VRILIREDATLRGLGADFVGTAIDVFINNLRVTQEAESPRFDGELLLITAERGRPEDAPAAAAWRPYVTGSVLCHGIDREHSNLVDPEALTEIGRIIEKRLSELPERLHQRPS